jgi:DNA-binding transcriptional LysR family regulator
MLNQIDLSRFDLNLLVLFETVFEERNVGRAAARLNLTPSAVSHGLGRLRAALGDPLFLRNPRGVGPTARAEALAAPVAEILSRVRGVVKADAFDPKTSRRRFVIGAPDGIGVIILPRLLAQLQKAAPGVDIAFRDVLPPFADGYEWLDERKIDVAILPVDGVPARFSQRMLYEEHFVVAMRAGHPLAKSMTLKRYCEAQHIVMSYKGDAHGNVDILLAQRGLKRRVAMVASNFMLALAIVSETDLLFAAAAATIKSQSRRFGLVSAPAPIAIQRYNIRAITPQTAMSDAGIAWLMDRLSAASEAAAAKQRRGA